ncbi:hypothetical protein [Nocardia pseudobrasiliensis]|uniref:hypothetical protein n=1 Tax=Nocardia pseudobrasiliensis TaxID=45979 RepID=UPI00082CA898|nr:hypothetical protein [Nocardia pseudobrasiliensis]
MSDLVLECAGRYMVNCRADLTNPEEAAQTSDLIRHGEDRLINFNDFDFEPGSGSAYQWVDIKIFNILDNAVDDRAIVQAIISAPEFQENYQDDGREITVHDPFLIEYFTPNIYLPTDADAIEQLLTEWTARCGTLPNLLKMELESSIISRIRSASSRYILGELEQSARCWFMDDSETYHEFLLIDRSAGEVALILASDD